MEGADTIFRHGRSHRRTNHPALMLEEEQQSVSVALYYKSTRSVTLGLSNGAMNARTILLAEITKYSGSAC